LRESNQANTYQYNENLFGLPAPALEAILSTPTKVLGQNNIKSIALIDTGATITIIPTKIVRELQLKYVDEITITGIEGIARNYYAYSVMVEFENIGYFIIKAAAANIGYVLVGRDILNMWNMLLSGPDRTFNIKY
jgi:predicted aspartyl protease